MGAPKLSSRCNHFFYVAETADQVQASCRECVLVTDVSTPSLSDGFESKALPSVNRYRLPFDREIESIIRLLDFLPYARMRTLCRPVGLRRSQAIFVRHHLAIDPTLLSVLVPTSFIFARGRGRLSENR